MFISLDLKSMGLGCACACFLLPSLGTNSNYDARNNYLPYVVELYAWCRYEEGI